MNVVMFILFVKNEHDKQNIQHDYKNTVFFFNQLDKQMRYTT